MFCPKKKEMLFSVHFFNDFQSLWIRFDEQSQQEIYVIRTLVLKKRLILKINKTFPKITFRKLHIRVCAVWIFFVFWV